MCVQSQEDYSLMKHALLSVYGKRWRERMLGMFTTYIDDSGTAPEHKIAVAAGIIIPGAKIVGFEREWKRLTSRENITSFHASECLARNPHSEFATWDDERVRRVFKEIRQLTIRFSVGGFCIGIFKDDYDELLTDNLKASIGNSYFTWAVSSLIGIANAYGESQKAPMHYVFDATGKDQKREISDSLEFAEGIYPGRFDGHWMFGKRTDIPALQAVDLVAWSCFQQFRRSRLSHVINPIADEVNSGYWAGRNGKWMIAQSLHREGIAAWVAKETDSPRTKEIIAFKEQLKEARKPKPKRAKTQ
jgi:Protein of unknown function (DUF3800)